MEVKVDKKFKNLQEKEYIEAINNEEFNALCNKLKISENEQKKNVNKMYDCLDELHNCKNCKSLYNCKNKVKGYVYFPNKKETNLVFTYTPCKYMVEASKIQKETNANILDNARMKDIKITKNRTTIIKWIKEYYDNFNEYKTSKGLYLHGNFGTGKTFLIAALFNEIKNKYGTNYEIIYFPELLRKLKENLNIVGDKINYLENVPLLLIDDIGAEKVTDWGRDEILGTILQTRMNKALPTFFTSNLNIIELEKHLSLTKDNEDQVKAKRIIERIKYLGEDIELLGNNYREG